MRAKASIEEAKNGRFEIIVSELPYQTSCSAIAARIDELVTAGELEGISDVNDDSSGGETSLIISLKRDGNPNVILNKLFKMTQLQSTFSINMVALVDGVPRQINLRDALVAYVRHQVDVDHPPHRVPTRRRPSVASTSSKAGSRPSTSSTRSSR